MTKTKIPLEMARRLVLNAQLVDSQTELSNGKEGIAEIVEKLGYVQIDPLAVIERAHHHTLWTRQPDYQPKMLHELQAKDQRLFEYWGHALSYMPISDYRYCLPRMRNFQNPKNKWAQILLEKSGHLMQPILERTRQEGPLSLDDFKSPKVTKSGTPGGININPTKAAFDLLFWRGDLMITERRDFQKFYDLTERVLPENVDTSYPDEDELGQFFVKRALSAFGVAREEEMHIFMQPESSRDAHMQATSKEVISKSLKYLVEAGEVIPVKIEDDLSSDYYALTKFFENSMHLESAPEQVHLLSPFDNLIIQRQRMKRLFGFDYALECYLPTAKRTYGYFVLPILWGENFVGRLDSKADRKNKTFIIHNLVFEPEFEAFECFLPALTNKIGTFAQFNQCEKVMIVKVSPVKIKPKLELYLKGIEF